MRTAGKYALAAVSAFVLGELLHSGVEAAMDWLWRYIDRCNVESLNGEFEILSELGR